VWKPASAITISMNLTHKDRKEKELLKLERELNDLWKAERNLPVIKLEKPIRHGWKKFFVLREDIANRSDAQVFREILERINSVVTCRKKNFKVKSGKKLVDIDHHLRSIPKDSWNFPEHYKKYFWLCGGCVHRHGPSYHFGPTFYFVTKIKPHYLTHVRVEDGDLESRKQKIYNKMRHLEGWQKLAKLHGYRYLWESGYDDLIFSLREDVAEQDMKKELKQYETEKIDH
jgi:hypothetical protein